MSVEDVNEETYVSSGVLIYFVMYGAKGKNQFQKLNFDMEKIERYFNILPVAYDKSNADILESALKVRLCKRQDFQNVGAENIYNDYSNGYQENEDQQYLICIDDP